MSPELLAKNVITLLSGMCWHDDAKASREIIKPNMESGETKLRIVFEPNAGDLRFCVGAQGRCIKGLQHIASTIGKLNGYIATISLTQNYEGKGPKEDREFVQNQAFNHGQIVGIAASLLASALNRRVEMVPRRRNDLLELKTITTDEEQPIVSALGEALYAYGFRQGCVIKLSTSNPEKAVA